jgi:hypothetical protein
MCIAVVEAHGKANSCCTPLLLYRHFRFLRLVLPPLLLVVLLLVVVV